MRTRVRFRVPPPGFKGPQRCGPFSFTARSALRGRPKLGLRAPAQQVHDGEVQHRLATLVDGLILEAGDAAVGLRRGRARLQHFDFAVQGIAGTHRGQPAQLVDPRRAEAGLGEHAGLDEQPEAHGEALEAAGDQPAVRRPFGRAGVEVERLRIVAPGEVDDLRLGQGQTAGDEAEARFEVVKIECLHVRRSLQELVDASTRPVRPDTARNGARCADGAAYNLKHLITKGQPLSGAALLS